MLFGNNPWGRRPPVGGPAMGQQPVAQPMPQAPVAQPYPMPTWPGQTADGNYALGLAQHFAQQLPNQMVPGSVPPQQAQMTQQQPVMQPPTMQPGWRGAFQGAMNDWRQQRPTDHGDLFAQWRQSRPDRQTYRMGSG